MKNIAEALEQAIPKYDIFKTLNPDEEYIEGDDIYCKKCHKPRTCMFGHTKVRCICECQVKEMELKKQFEMQQARQARIEKMRTSSLLGAKYSNVRFSNTTIIDEDYHKIFNRCKRYCEVADEVLKRGIGIYLYGSKGVGKTHLTACMANELIDEYNTVIYTNFSEISRRIRATFSNRNETEADFMEKLANVDFLFIDDFGTETVQRNETDVWLQEKVFEVINRRYNNNKPIIFTSNYSLRELIQERGMADKTVDRINEMCETMKIEGKSYRLMAKEQREKLF